VFWSSAVVLIKFVSAVIASVLLEIAVFFEESAVVLAKVSAVIALLLEIAVF
jgi:hypothetical protein